MDVECVPRLFRNERVWRLFIITVYFKGEKGGGGQNANTHLNLARFLTNFDHLNIKDDANN